MIILTVYSSLLTATAGEFSSYLLRCCLTLDKDGGKFPDYEDVLEYFAVSLTL